MKLINLNWKKKSLFYGIFIGIISTLFFLFLLGNIETEIIVNASGKNNKDISKDINVTIEKTINNGQELINILASATGNVSRKDIDEELERLYKQYDIDKNNSNLNIKIKINN